MNLLKRIARITAYVAVAFTVTAIIGAIIGNENTPDTFEIEKRPLDTAKSRLSEQENAYRQAFMYSCNKEATESYCQCTLDFMIDTYGYDRVLDISQEYANDTGTFPEEMMEAASNCIDLY